MGSKSELKLIVNGRKFENPVVWYADNAKPLDWLNHCCYGNWYVIEDAAADTTYIYIMNAADKENFVIECMGDFQKIYG